MAILRKTALVAAILALAAISSNPASAQTREEIQRAPVSPLPKGTGQRVDVQGEIERAPCPLADPAYASITFTLTGADFSGLQGLDASLLRASYASSIGKTLPIAAVCDIRDAAATILRRKGYLAAVQVPAQTIEGGTVKFDVLMAKIVGFQVRGDAGRSEGVITRYLNAIKEMPIFNIVEAERYLLLARDLPGLDVRLTLRPAGTRPGEVIGEVMVARSAVEAEVNVQNYGSQDTGRFGGLAQVHFNGLLGEGDRTTFGFFSTADFKEQKVAQFSEELRVGGDGLNIAASALYAWTHPSLGPTIDIRSEAFVSSLEARYPLVRRQTRNVLLSGGLEWVDQKVNLSGIPLSRDHLRVAYAKLGFDRLDTQSIASIGGYSASEPRWRVGGEMELRQGLSFLGASDGCGPTLARCALPGVVPISRLEGDPSSFVMRGRVAGEFRPTPSVAMVLSARAQYAPHPLLSYEEFSAGNFTTGRGYDPGSLTGDSGLGLSGEFRYGSLVPASRSKIAWQLYGFADGAWVWNEDTAPSVGRQHLYSAGGGVRAAYGDRFVLDAGAAVPLNRAGTQTKRSDVRFLVNLTVKLLPWKR